MSDGGKGSNARPILIDKEEFKRKWDDIFGDKPILSGYCGMCNKKHSWCECWENGKLGRSMEHAVPASKELCEAIDTALGIKRKNK
jgi:hypothetical protein